VLVELLALGMHKPRDEYSQYLDTLDDSGTWRRQ
jgi:hypothetical protein